MRTPPATSTFHTPTAVNLTSSTTINNNNNNINPLHHRQRLHHHHTQQAISPTFPPTPPHFTAPPPLLSPSLARRSTSPTRPPTVMPSTRPPIRHRATAPSTAAEAELQRRDDDIGGHVRIIPSLLPQDDDAEAEEGGDDERSLRAGEVDSRLSRVAEEVLLGGRVRAGSITGGSGGRRRGSRKGRETMETEVEIAREEVMARLREVVGEKVEGGRWRFEGEALEVMGF